MPELGFFTLSCGQRLYLTDIQFKPRKYYKLLFFTAPPANVRIVGASSIQRPMVQLPFAIYKHIITYYGTM